MSENEYEIRRQQNIARNEEFLRSLGLADIKQQIDVQPYLNFGNLPKSRKASGKRRKLNPEDHQVRRSSRRGLVGGDANVTGIVNNDDYQGLAC